MKMEDVGYGRVMHFTFMEENFTSMEEYSILNRKAFQKSCQRMRFFAFLGHFRL